MTRIGLIGTGDVAHIHIAGLLTNSNYEIVGCYSPENCQSMMMARHYRLISYSSPEALLKYADAVDIADNLPETMILAELSLKAMKHVFIAQPDRLSMEQWQYLKKLAEESGVILQSGTGYRYCPAYEILSESMQTAKVVDMRHQLVNHSDLYARLSVELPYDFDFVTGILQTSISKLDVKTWTKSENLPDMLHCRMECDNGCAVNLTVYTVAEGKPKLEFTFISSDAVIRADIFKSVIEKQYRACDRVDSIILDAYSDRIIHQHYLQNFYRAICSEYDAIRSIDEQFRNKAAAGYIVDRIKQLQPASSSLRSGMTRIVFRRN
jgi:predicted dehydrogenase